MGKYIKWSDEYRVKMESEYHNLSMKTGEVEASSGLPISTRNMSNSVLKNHIDRMRKNLRLLRDMR